VPGEYPFYFDDIQGVSLLVRGRYGGQQQDQSGDDDDDVDVERLVYATFSTPINSIGASAVCAFRLRDISDAFSGRFKEQRSMSANWLPVEEHKVRNTYLLLDPSQNRLSRKFFLTFCTKPKVRTY
jgi:semaphorin 6